MTNVGWQGALNSLTSSKTPKRGKRKLGGVVWTFGAADKRVQGRTSSPPPTAILSSISRLQEPAASRLNCVVVDNLPPGKVGNGGRRPGGESSAPRRGENSSPGVGCSTDRGHHENVSGNGDETPAAANGSSKRQHTSNHSSDGGVDAAVSLRAPRRSEKNAQDVLVSPSNPIVERSRDELTSPPQGRSCRPLSSSATTTESLVGKTLGVVLAHPEDIANTLDDAVSQSAAGATTPERSAARHVAKPPAHENDTTVVSTAGDASVPCTGPSKEGTGHERERVKAVAAMPTGFGQEKTTSHRNGGSREEEEEDAAMAGRVGIRLRCLTGNATKITKQSSAVLSRES